MAESYYLQSLAKLEPARMAARRATELAPDNGFAWTRLAELEFSAGHNKAARAAIEKGLALTPENARAHALRGFILSADNRIAEARAAFRKLRPPRWRVRQRLARPGTHQNQIGRSGRRPRRSPDRRHRGADLVDLPQLSRQGDEPGRPQSRGRQGPQASPACSIPTIPRRCSIRPSKTSRTTAPTPPSPTLRSRSASMTTAASTGRSSCSTRTAR